jgi:hypothetical protein
MKRWFLPQPPTQVKPNTGEKIELDLLILGKCKQTEEREFYLRLCLREKWGKRELEREMAGALFERTILSRPKLPPLVTELHSACR